MPMVRVTAKPLMLPLAIEKRMIAEISEVMFASKMAENALS